MSDTAALADSRGLLLRVWRGYVLAHMKWLIVALVLMTIEGGMLGLLSYLVRPMFDTVFVAGDTSAIGLVAGAVFALFLVRAASGFGQRYLVVTIGLNVVTQLQRDLTAHLLRLDPIFFQRNAPGGLIERVRGDAQALQQAASTALMTLGRDTVSLVSLLAVAFWVDWVWALLVFAGVPLIVAPVWLLQRLIRRTARGARGASATLSTRLDEIFHGITAIKVNSLEEHENTRFGAAIATYLRAETVSQAGRAALPALVDVLAALGFMGVLLYGGQQIASGEKSVGEFMSFFTAMALLFDPLRRLSNVSGQIQAALASLERLYGLFDTKATIGNRPGASQIPPVGDIVFNDVRFAYDGNPVLDGLSFVAKAGQTTALVGASGAGKSTVFNMLTRLIEPASGTVSIGGTDIGGLDLGVLRRQFSLVSQDAALFDESLSRNIALGRLDATANQIAAAAEVAEVRAFADEMPQGLDSPAGPRGSNLSGGQRQRVAIARAVLRDAPILLLDEPTSALDAKSETAIQAALTHLAEGRTTLVIAHRLSTIQDADRILVLDRGRLVDEGTHDELLAKGGAYAQLYALQFRPNDAPSAPEAASEASGGDI